MMVPVQGRGCVGGGQGVGVVVQFGVGVGDRAGGGVHVQGDRVPGWPGPGG